MVPACAAAGATVFAVAPWQDSVSPLSGRPDGGGSTAGGSGGFGVNDSAVGAVAGLASDGAARARFFGTVFAVAVSGAVVVIAVVAGIGSNAGGCLLGSLLTGAPVHFLMAGVSCRARASLQLAVRQLEYKLRCG